MSINLSDLEIIDFPSAPLFVYREKIGPFQVNAPKAWQEFWESTSTWFNRDNSTMMLSANFIDGTKEGDDKYLYRAGVILKTPPECLPEGKSSCFWNFNGDLPCVSSSLIGITLGDLDGGKYAKFLLTGPYSQLALAFPTAYTEIGRCDLTTRTAFAFEVYLNTPASVSDESQLLTEIYIPVN